MLEMPAAQKRYQMSLSPEKRLVNKYKRAYIRQQKEKEYKRLRAVVPALAKRQHVKKLTVIEEAIRYIDQLHNTLISRVHVPESDLPATGMTQDALISASHQLFLRQQRAKAPLTPRNDINIYMQSSDNNATSHDSYDVMQL